jgi:hypothetical protein
LSSIQESFHLSSSRKLFFSHPPREAPPSQKEGGRRSFSKFLGGFAAQKLAKTHYFAPGKAAKRLPRAFQGWVGANSTGG